MAKVPTKSDASQLPRSSSEHIKSRGVRKRTAKYAEQKSKTTPPESRVLTQSEKSIPRRAGRMSYEATRGFLLIQSQSEKNALAALHDE